MKLLLLILLHMTLLFGGTYGEYIARGTTGSTPEYPMGIAPDDGTTYWKRPYKVEFTSKFDGRTDTYTIALPHSFDPSKSYPVWFKFKPYYGSGTNTDYPTFAWNLCDSQDVIFVGCNLRGPEGWFGDNTKNLDSLDQANISKDMVELVKQLAANFNITYVASFGASMGGYSALRFLTHLPKEYVGVSVPSCPALYFRSWCADGSDSVMAKVEEGFFNDVFVTLFHGEADNTVPVSVSENLTAVVPDETWWNYVPVPDAGHKSFFVSDGGPFPRTEDWGISPIVLDIWEQIEAWENAFPEKSQTVIDPTESGWKEDDHWYLPENMVGLKEPVSLSHTNTLNANSKIRIVQNGNTIEVPLQSVVSIYDIRGRKFSFLHDGGAISLDALACGVYTVKVRNGTRSVTQKVVVQ